MAGRINHHTLSAILAGEPQVDLEARAVEQIF